MRRLLRYLLIITISAIGLELVLQAGAVVVALSFARDQTVSSENVVLCVGDSYTYGVGASDADSSYPGRLRSLLRESASADVEVFNAGYPGRNSTDVFDDFDNHLARLEPRVVCILVGTNDRWRHPTPVSAGSELTESTSAAAPGFVWRWRTARLFQWAFGNQGSAYAHVEAASADTKSEADQEVDAGSSTPAAPPTPAVGRNRLVEVGVAWKMLRDEKFGELRSYLDEAMALDPANVHVLRQIRATMCARVGERAQAEGEITALLSLYETQPSPRVASSLMLALHALGDKSRGLELGEKFAELYPDESGVWFVLASFYGVDREHEKLEYAADRFLALAGEGAQGMRASVYNLLAIATRDDPPERVRFAVRDFLVSGQTSRTEFRLRRTESMTAEGAIDAIANLEMTTEQRDQIHDLFRRVYDEKSDDYLEIYEANLRLMIAKSRAAGAEPVILCYPMEVPEIEPIQRRVANVEGVAFIDVRERFVTEHEGLSPKKYFDKLFSPDGHCNDAGYAIMAELATPVVTKILSTDF